MENILPFQYLYWQGSTNFISSLKCFSFTHIGLYSQHSQSGIQKVTDVNDCQKMNFIGLAVWIGQIVL